MTRHGTPMGWLIGIALLVGGGGLAWAQDALRVLPEGATESVSPEACVQEVDGNRFVAVSLGDVEVRGRHEGGIAILGGSVRLGPGSQVTGPVLVVGGSLHRGDETRISGDTLVMEDAWVREAVRAFYGKGPDPTAPSGSRFARHRTLTIAADEVVTGDVIVVAGRIVIEGRVDGNVVALGSAVEVRDGAEVGGDLVSTGEARLEGSGGVHGKVHRIGEPRLAFTAPPAEAPAAPLAEALNPEREEGEPDADATEASDDVEVVDLDSLRVVREGNVVAGTAVIGRGERWNEPGVLGGSAIIESGAGAEGDLKVTAGSLVLSGRLVGGLEIKGGRAKASRGSRIEGDVSVKAGALDLAGTVTGELDVEGGSAVIRRGGVVEGDVTVKAGSIRLEDGARVEGNINSAGGDVSRAEGAVISGDITGDDSSIRITAKSEPPRVSWISRLVAGLAWKLLLFGSIVLVATVWPGRVQTVADAIRFRPGQCLGAGFLATVVIAALVLAVTLVTCGLGVIVAVPLGTAVLTLSWWLGTTAIALLFGEWLGRRMRVGPSGVLNCVLLGGALLVVTGAVSPGFGSFHAGVFSVLAFTLGMLAIGGVLRTQWGASPDGSTRLLPGVFEWRTYAPVGSTGVFVTGTWAGAPSEPPAPPEPTEPEEPTEPGSPLPPPPPPPAA